jgi:hypothetical protein
MMVQAAPRRADEIIEVEHSNEGTRVRIEDPSFLEFAAWSVLVLVFAALVFVWLRRRKS